MQGSEDGGGGVEISWTASAAPFGPGAFRAIADDGFAIWQRFLTAPALAFLRREVDVVLRAKHPSVDSEWIQNIHQHPEGAWMWRLASCPGLVQAAQCACGGESVILYGSQIAVRMPRASGAVGVAARRLDTTPWHQDGPGTRVATFWITLDHADQHTGALEVLRGGHLMGRRAMRRLEHPDELPLAKKMASHNVFEIDKIDAKTVRREAFAYRLRAGGAGVHHSSLPHRAGPNLSSKPRRVIILRYMHADELSSNDQGRLRHWQTNDWFAREYRRI